MPKHTYKCQKCKKTISKVFPIGSTVDSVTCECGDTMRKTYNTNSNFIMEGQGCDAARRKREEDLKIGRQAARARDLKNSGKIPLHEVIKIDDKKVRD